ncbi:hypothetical protein SBC2_73730 (plasmid) [Caballeronia sp. SBC2]|jgi:drug/metabolite transporter (DMT)-like permease|nr:hypothetical protein SBC2_73730 [Caballeronia sp. SBC2]
MKAFRQHRQPASDHKREGSLTSPGTGSALTSREKHYLVWGILRLILGVMQMTFALAAMLHLIYFGLSRDTLIYAAVATIATLVSRLLFRGRRGTP